MPENAAGWVDFWSGKKYRGGQTTEVDIDLAKIPLFVKGGSIFPFSFGKQYASECKDTPLEIRIYPGADATFVLYEDEGDNYNYEQGKFIMIEFEWNENKKTFVIANRKGGFEGMEKVKRFNLVLVSPEEGIGAGASLQVREIIYEGKKQTIKI